MGKPFKLEFASFDWEYDERLLEAWKQGKTGYPIGKRYMQKMVRIEV